MGDSSSSATGDTGMCISGPRNLPHSATLQHPQACTSSTSSTSSSTSTPSGDMQGSLIRRASS
eukprot:928757-Rhodomonas_salina.1